MKESILKNHGFEFLLASPPDYDAMVCEIYYNGSFLCLISQEEGQGLFMVEFPGPGLDESKIVREVDLGGFLAACRDGAAILGAK